MKTVLCLSGGLDSTTALFSCLKAGDTVLPVLASYPSRHNMSERKAAREIVSTAYQMYQEKVMGEVTIEVPDKVFDGSVSNLLKNGSTVPEGEYNEDNIQLTVVPNRNMIFISYAVAIAWSRGMDRVVLGVHAGDHAVYPDCRPEFIVNMKRAVDFGTNGRIMLDAPFLYDTKTQVVKHAKAVGAPLELTYSCYRGGYYHCGTCATCLERKKAFKEAGIADRTQYNV